MFRLLCERCDMASNVGRARNRNPGSPGTFLLDYLGLLPSVAQPPLPLQEFLPLQPASLVLQPPWPLQAFCPLQAWVPLSAKVWRETPA